jgi:nucleoside-diphosphate-sugar epimerase
MNRVLVTGCAGFIGSHLAERLLGENYEVVGIDSFTDYYPPELKNHNIRQARENKNFQFIAKSLLEVNLRNLLRGVDYIFHEAAQAGVRHSWGKNFQIYADNNLLATQKLLEACKDAPVKKLIYASSSSVYGDLKKLPMEETDLPAPISPYGVSKLAGEHLCYLYWKNFSLPFISLRYFTVYGPRQRPDMAFHKFIKALLRDEEIEIYGDGNQTRDFTYISDAIDANLLAMNSSRDKGIFNIGGGSMVTVNETIRILEELTAKKARLRYIPKQKGDMRHTYADTSQAREKLGYAPRVTLKEGLKKEIEWVKKGII